MTTLNDIRAALENHLLTTVGLPDIALPNQKYEKSPDTAYIRAQFTPTSRRPDVRGPNPMQRIEGLYLLTVCQPEYSGEGPGLQVADVLMDRFEATTDIAFSDFRIGIDYAELGLSFPDSPFYCTPVVVSWFTYHQGETS